jgi:hypothetical protein
MKFTITLSLLLILLGGCTNPNGATTILGAQGFTDIQINPVGPGWLFRCSEDDQVRTPFTAVSPSGTEVNGVVCTGFLKGSTIRFD